MRAWRRDGTVVDEDFAIGIAADHLRHFIERVAHAHVWAGRIDMDQAGVSIRASDRDRRPGYERVHPDHSVRTYLSSIWASDANFFPRHRREMRRPVET